MDASPYGLHRVVSPPGVLPQQAEVLDPALPLRDGEVMIDVERLNLDAASFHQLLEETGGHPEELRTRVVSIVKSHGKMHNPVTGSGGMLIGTVAAVGEGRTDLKRGNRVATLVSLTLTPLVLYSIAEWDGRSEQVPAQGYAILFAGGLYAKLPEDLPDALSLAVLDVAGAPAQVARLANPGERVVVIGGGGKSGILCLFAARERGADVVALVPNRDQASAVEALGFAAAVADATDPVASASVAGGEADLVVNCVNVPGTEGASLLIARDGGTVLFFSMATSFTAAALGAEGLGKDLRLLIGTGYVPGHAELALDLLRRHPELRLALEERFGGR
ncbi:MAG: zinc-binding dehydrogenase [Actinobacteria bacterium]|nr:zinc-binding dehydrogenase [Actinomycetota bacterium]